MYGKDYDGSYSATMRQASFRTLLALAAHHRLKLDHVDLTPKRGRERRERGGRTAVVGWGPGAWVWKQLGDSGLVDAIRIT